MATPPAVHDMRLHILNNLAHHRALNPGTASPLFVGVQGPQGSGKSYLTNLLKESLTSSPYNLSVVVLSIDDLYLPHDQLVSLAESKPNNPLLRGRGQPGTHDVELGIKILRQLQHINEDGSEGVEVELPVFDKSLYGGEGDRLPRGIIVRSPVDVVIMEGWCVGFYPISREDIEGRWDKPVQGLGHDFFQRHGFKKDDVIDINKRLKAYLEWWNFFSVFIQIKPVNSHPYVYIYEWRVEQEHYMKALNGGKGMTDEQVKAFIDRYIPGYVFFGDGVIHGGIQEDGSRVLPPWLERGMKLQIDERREVVHVGSF